MAEPRGFAAMDPAKQREIASKGGRAAHEQGTAHEFTSEEAREAGRKGGQASHAARGDARRGARSNGNGSEGCVEQQGAVRRDNGRGNYDDDGSQQRRGSGSAQGVQAERQASDHDAMEDGHNPDRARGAGSGGGTAAHHNSSRHEGGTDSERETEPVGRHGRADD